jgi:hypothetical protein
MMAQGVYILALWCTNLFCMVPPVPLEIYRHKDMCIIAKARYEYHYPQFTFTCTQEGDS